VEASRDADDGGKNGFLHFKNVNLFDENSGPSQWNKAEHERSGGSSGRKFKQMVLKSSADKKGGYLNGAGLGTGDGYLLFNQNYISDNDNNYKVG
jgi:hypothetical protein